MNPTFSPEQRATLAALADVLIPAYQNRPAASAVGIETELLDAVLLHRPDIAEPLAEALRIAEGMEPRAALALLFAQHRNAFDHLGLAVSGGYFMSPVVRESIGYPGQENAPFDPYETPPYEANGMLDRVRARGPIHRPTPR